MVAHRASNCSMGDALPSFSSHPNTAVRTAGTSNQHLGKSRCNLREFHCYENISGVTTGLGVTVLPTLISLKFVHLKFQQKYEWIENVSIYHHAKIEMQLKFVLWETKKRNQPMNSSGLRVWDEQLNPQLFKCKIHFFVSSCPNFCLTSNFTWW